MTIMNELEKFLLNEIAVDFEKKSLAPEENLITQGIIDSLGILKLVSFIEKTYEIKINNEDIIPDNFQTLNSLNEFITKRLKK